ncbi:TPA: hypothetical protein K8E71_002196 [Listeria monocytogenes]|nr:hypothetical protein [Listeria monocytogenes]
MKYRKNPVAVSMENNEKVIADLKECVEKGYEILMKNIDVESKEVVQAAMKLSAVASEITEFEFKRNILIGALENIK